MSKNLPNRVNPINVNAAKDDEICARLIQLREMRYGKRGKSAFARDLEIPVTTYVHYEAGRTPPVDFLVKVAHVTGVRLEWLILGSEPREPDQGDRSLFKTGLTPLSLPGHRALIPLVGSTSAGLAHYWSELDSKHGPDVDRQLEDVLSRCLEKSKVPGETRHSIPNKKPRSTGESKRVALIQYSEPDSDGVLEFVSAPELKQRYPDAVAWRIDGESMSPRYSNGDLVITSLSIVAVDFHPCVARQQGQIGVNCKIYQSDGNDILLIPVNKKYNTQRIPREHLRWAYRVISSIKLQT